MQLCIDQRSAYGIGVGVGIGIESLRVTLAFHSRAEATSPAHLVDI